MNNSKGLDVYVDGVMTGRLSRSDTEKHRYLFAYEKEDRLNPVSLIMPVRNDQYVYNYRLHPVFDMNIPEGWLKDKLHTQFSKVIKNFDDLDLLEIVGKSQIGNLRFIGQGNEISDIPGCDLNKILGYQGADDLLESLLVQYGAYSGISGAQPKVLVRDRNSTENPSHIAHKYATHIVKSWKDDYPELAANEYFCMRAALHSGLTIPEINLSENGKFLIVKRFDLKDDVYFGFEDFCALAAQPSMKKYDGSYEKIARHIKYFVSPDEINTALKDFFKSLVLSCAVKNGDAHLKNFGLLYDSEIKKVSLSPTYDIVSTTPYNKKDTLALMLKGSKRWPKEKDLINFGKTYCDLSESQIKIILNEVSMGIHASAEEMINYMDRHENFRDIGSSMIDEWGDGLSASLNIKSEIE
jgi:serine/threonine-protein kinase HipA